MKVKLEIMSGVEDGMVLNFNSRSDGKMNGDAWAITIGRRDDNDVCLRNDTFISRHHATLHWKDGRWWLEDCKSKNGTYVEGADDQEEDARVSGIIPINITQLFRIGRTWMHIQQTE